MDNIIIRELNLNDVNNNLLDYFNRYQEVKKCYRKENGKWELKNIEYIEDWDNNKKDKIIKKISKTINKNGFVIGVYENEKIIGFAILLNQKFGSKKQYIQLDNIQISFGYRNKGLGKKLFEKCIEKAKGMKIGKIYISANTSEETQIFYRKNGCTDAMEINKELAEEEPYDRQMEYKILNKL
jgi:N-acetylglutamate synthase-like GNAT family acetyltransferase